MPSRETERTEGSLKFLMVNLINLIDLNEARVRKLPVTPTLKAKEMKIPFSIRPYVINRGT